MTKLQPCPFCGSEKITAYSGQVITGAWVACLSCGLETPTETGITHEKAVEYWNARATAAAQPVAWLRDTDEGEGGVSTDLCDKDEPGAYAVYRASPPQAMRSALAGLIEAVRRDSDEDGKCISGYTSARLSDARAALAATGHRAGGEG